MNKSKLPMPAQLRKKMNKEIRAAAANVEPEVQSNRIKPEQLLSRYPTKIRKKDLSLLKSFEKTVEIKKKKKNAKHSKRTSPGAVEAKSSPGNAHREGKKWRQTLEKQELVKIKVFTRHSAKKGKR